MTQLHCGEDPPQRARLQFISFDPTEQPALIAWALLQCSPNQAVWDDSPIGIFFPPFDPH